jgi:hypothetical protein
MLKSILLISLIIFTNPSFSNASALENAMIDGVKFLDDIPEVEWYRVSGKNLVIGWKGIPQIFSRINLRAAIRSTITTGRETQVWAVRHHQKKWEVGNEDPDIWWVIARNGRVKSDTCPQQKV